MAPPQTRISDVFLSVDPGEKDYADAAVKVLRTLGIDVHQAAPERHAAPLALVDEIAAYDACVLVVGRRYGFIPEGESVSQLEMEYDLAGDAGLPILAYVRGQAGAAPGTGPEELVEDQALLKFRQRLTERQTVRFFRSADELSELLMVDVQRLGARLAPREPPAPVPEHDSPDGPPAATVEALAATPFSSGAESVVQAAALWAASGPTPVRVSTHLLLFALEQLGSPGPGAGWAGDFFRQQLGALGAPWYARRDDWLGQHALGGRMPAPDELQPPPGIGLTPAAVRVLDRAREIAADTSGGGTVAGRHLAAALLTERAGALEYLSVPGPFPEPALLRDRLFAWVRGYGDDDEAWRRILSDGRPPALHLARFDADDVRGGELRHRDLLGIERDVLAFATLVGSRALVPPLSIGLFGEWGSGKTFFMRRLREEVAEISRRARASGRPQGSLDFYKHVVQIDFNAWHYVEGNLWASLVEHIFRNLRVGDERRDVVEEMQRHWVKQLEFEKQALDEAVLRKDDAGALVQDAQAKLDEAVADHLRKAQELGELSRRNVQRAFDLSGALAAVNGAVRGLGLEPLGSAAGELQASLNQARAVLQRGSVALTPLLRAPDRRRRRFWLAVILFGAPLLGGAIAVAMALLGADVIGQITGFAAGAAALLGSLAEWMRRQSAWMSESIARVEGAQKTYDEELAARQAESARKIAAAEQELALVRERYAVALRARDEAARRAAQAERELRQANAGRLLARFVEDRAASTDYRKHLGVLAVIRDDFERLSALIEAENARLAAPGGAADEAAGAATRINRIVLYIDDLDRCPPAKVVEVLQAVHLLLAFPLFVVVVGVDARWVSRSLESRYRELLQAGAPGEAAELRRTFDIASTGDYLEKIFQVPFWVQPLDAEGSRRMLRRIFTPERPAPPGDAAAGADGAGGPASLPSRTEPRDAADAGTGEGQGPEQVPDAGADGATDASGGGAAAGEDGAPAVPGAESLEIGEDELRFIDGLAPLLGRSPRALKRFANVYRIMKAGLTPAERASFMQSPNLRMAGYQCVLFLLAVDTGLPELAPRLFDLVLQGAATRPWEADHGEEAEAPEDEQARDPARYQRDWLLAELAKLVQPPGPEWEQLRTLDRWLEGYRDQMEEWSAVYRLSRWVPRVSQFSFQPPARTLAAAP